MQKLSAPVVGAQGYQRFPLYKSVVGRNIDLHAVPDFRASIYLVYAFQALSTSFSQLFSTLNCGMCIE